MATRYTFRSYAAGATRTWTRSMTPSFRAFDVTSPDAVSGLSSLLRPESRRSHAQESGDAPEGQFREAEPDAPSFPTSLGKLYTSIGQMDADGAL